MDYISKIYIIIISYSFTILSSIPELFCVIADINLSSKLGELVVEIIHRAYYPLVFWYIDFNFRIWVIQ